MTEKSVSAKLISYRKYKSIDKEAVFLADLRFSSLALDPPDDPHHLDLYDSTLKKSSNAFSAVDPMPTWLVKDCLGVLISPITNIVNKSLSLGVFTRSMKAALVKPLIKKKTVSTVIF